MKREIKAQTFTPTYDGVEDRIRLSINYQDIHNRVDLMITRSFILNLLPSAEEFFLKRYAREFSTSQKQGTAQEQLKSEQKIVSTTDMPNLELLKREDELLREVHFSIDPKTKHTNIVLETNTTKVTATLDARMFEKLFDVLKNSLPFIKWGISPDF